MWERERERSRVTKRYHIGNRTKRFNLSTVPYIAESESTVEVQYCTVQNERSAVVASH